MSSISFSRYLRVQLKRYLACCYCRCPELPVWPAAANAPRRSLPSTSASALLNNKCQRNMSIRMISCNWSNLRRFSFVSSTSRETTSVPRWVGVIISYQQEWISTRVQTSLNGRHVRRGPRGDRREGGTGQSRLFLWDYIRMTRRPVLLLVQPLL